MVKLRGFVSLLKKGELAFPDNWVYNQAFDILNGRPYVYPTAHMQNANRLTSGYQRCLPHE